MKKFNIGTFKRLVLFRGSTTTDLPDSSSDEEIIDAPDLILNAAVESERKRLQDKNTSELIKSYLAAKSNLLKSEKTHSVELRDSKIDVQELKEQVAQTIGLLSSNDEAKIKAIQTKFITIINNLYNRQFQYILTTDSKSFYVRVRHSKNDLEYNPYEYAIQLLKTVVGITEFFSCADDQVKKSFLKLSPAIIQFMSTLQAVIEKPNAHELPFDTRLLEAGQMLIAAIENCFLTKIKELAKTILEYYGIASSKEKLQTLLLYFRDLCLWSKDYKFDPVINIEKRKNAYCITETQPIKLDASVFEETSKEWLKKEFSSFSEQPQFKILIEEVIKNNLPLMCSKGRSPNPSLREPTPLIPSHARVVFTVIIDQNMKNILVFNSINLSGSLSPPMGEDKLKGITSSLPESCNPALHATHLAYRKLLFSNSSLADSISLFESLYGGFTIRPDFIFVEMRLLTGKMFENKAVAQAKIDDNNFAMANNVRELAKAIKENSKIKGEYKDAVNKYYSVKIDDSSKKPFISDFHMITFNYGINSKADAFYSTFADKTSKEDISFSISNTESLKAVIEKLIDFLKGNNLLDEAFLEAAKSKCKSFSLEPKKIEKRTSEIDDVMGISPIDLVASASKESLLKKINPIIEKNSSPPQFRKLIENELIYRIQSMALILSLPENPRFNKLKTSQKNLIFAALSTLLVGSSGFVNAGCKSARDRTFLLLLGRYILLDGLEQFLNNDPGKIIQAIEAETDNLFPIQASYGLVPALKANEVNSELGAKLRDLNKSAREFHLMISEIVRYPLGGEKTKNLIENQIGSGKIKLSDLDIKPEDEPGQ